MEPAESPLALYQAGFVLCSGHGKALEDEQATRRYVTKHQLMSLMNAEEADANKAEQVAVTQKETPMETLPNAPVDLRQFAAELNSRSTDGVAPAQAPKVVVVPTPDTPAEQTYTDKAAVAAELRRKIAQAQDNISATQALIDANHLPDLLKVNMVNTVKAYQKEIATYERQLAKLQEPAVRYVSMSKDMAELRQAVFAGGIEALQALDAALASGLLSGKKTKTCTKVISSDEQAERVKDAEGHVQARRDNEARNTEIVRLWDEEGLNRKQIAERLGISPNAVTGVCDRAGRFERDRKVA